MRRGGPFFHAFAVSALLLCLLLPHSVLPAQDAASEQELARIIKAIDAVKGELAGLRRERGGLQKDVESAERRISEVRGALKTTQSDLTQAQTRLSALHQEAEQLDKQRRDQQDLVATYLRQAARTGEQSSLKLLLNQEQPQQAARLLRYNGYLTRARAALIQGYADNLARLDEVQRGIDTERLTLEARQRDLSAQDAQLASAQSARKTALTSLDTKLSSHGAELERLETQRIDIEVLLKELRRSITELPLDGSDQPITALKGRLPWPLQGRLTRSFGSRHELGDLTWEGLTLIAPAGTEVRAVHHGRVVFADWFGSSGLLLIVDHGDGYMSLYAHNQELYKAVGEWVGNGAVIAAAGNTGGQSETGLYFEMRHNGRAEDPANWLRARN
ncbi:MAG: peptidoglycan DD-metalloendopeptidase family protein [Pseudomonadales bacterium]|jgi:septal ring factor EnvC (AmiA/AmiB activator)|nr:peptidoglycan DD-metalloendopeptidase family protein [Pseudomonadales bacterium]